MDREIKYEKIDVEYIDHMGSDIRVSNVAKVSFNKWDDESLPINKKQAGLLEYLATGLRSDERDDWEKRAKASTHFTPFGHCFLSIRVAVPIFLARQLVKHQIGLCWNEESRRYIDDDIALYIPEIVHSRPEGSIKQGSGGVHTSNHIKCTDDYHCTALEAIQLSSEQAVMNYYELIEKNVAPEEARMILPLNSMTHYVWSGSLMAFLRVVKQRVDPHAQLAAQEFANKLLPILKDKFPESVRAFGF